MYKIKQIKIEINCIIEYKLKNFRRLYMKLSSYLNPKCIYLNLEGNTKEDIIGQIIDNTAKHDKTFSESVDLIRKSVFAREAEVSTAMGNGIAIPHARIDGYDDILL